nr:cupredoxin domain-containing protein [Kineococcus aurantiacus]
MASASLLPLIAAAAVHRGRRWAPLAALLAVATTVGIRTTDLSFDLIRPGDPAPFAVAVLELLVAGLSLSGAAVTWTARRRSGETSGPSGAVFAIAGTAAAVAVGAVLLTASPQGEHTGGLSEAQRRALPSVDMVNYRFEAAQLRAGEGEPVAFRFTNDTDDSHSFTVDQLGIDVTVPSGRDRVVVLDAPAGEYEFHCSVGSHRRDGMEGRLVVTADAGAASTRPAASLTLTGDHPGGHHHG